LSRSIKQVSILMYALCWLLGSSVQKSEIFGGMISLSDQTAP